MNKRPRGGQSNKDLLSAKIPLTQLPPINLENKRPVRTTFRLSKAGSEALEFVSKYHKIRFKEAIENLCQKFLTKEVVSLVASLEIKNDLLFRKTYVLSQGSLEALNKASKEYKVPRDVVLDRSLILFQLLVEEESTNKKEKREKALKLIRECTSTLYDYEKKLKDILGSDDPVIHRFGFSIVILDNLKSAIEFNLKEDNPIDPEDMSQSC